MHTTSQAATKLRRSLRSVQRACAAHKIGTRFGKSLALTDADIERLRGLIPGEVGNPNFAENAAAHGRKGAAARKKRLTLPPVAG